MKTWTSILLTGLVLCMHAGVLRAGSLDKEEMRTLFREGEGFFRQGNDSAVSDPERSRELYRKAIMRFERIVRDGGIDNGRLYYDIGNAYFRLEDIGRAILYYRKAMQYMPNDENLLRNLQYARSKCADRFEVEEKTRVLKTVFFWHYDIPFRARTAVFLVVFAGMWVFAGFRLFYRSVSLNWLIGITVTLSVVLLGSLVWETIHLRTTRPGVVLKDEVIARKGDSESYQKSFDKPLHAGTEFMLLEQRSDWSHIELLDGRECWVPTEYVGFVR